MKKNTILGLFCSLFILQVTGCGGGPGDNSQAPVTSTQKTAVITFSIMSTNRLPVRINGIEITAYLPSGVTVPTESTTPSQVSASALAAGSAVTGAISTSNYVFGSYSASSRKINIFVADSSGAQSGFGPGSFAQLTCNVTNGTTLTGNDFVILNNPFPHLKAIGYDPASRSSIDLTSYLTPSLEVTF